MTDVLNLRSLLGMARATVMDPQGGGRVILDTARGMPAGAVWLCFSIIIVGSLIMGELASLMLGPLDDGPLTGQPTLVMGLVQAASLFLVVHAITHIGRLFGGQGEFLGALALMTWLQFVFLLVQVVMLLTTLVLPPLGAIVMTLALGLFLWLFLNFIAVLHGFQSLGAVFVMTLVSFIAIIFVISLVLSLLGIVTVEPT
ncbi:YIP1 family protein [Gymnodinialimonas sp. 2305UL16-5]|uniref:Yip1 family protein n=1 Tax=Gymnodinialimonas mytili TaxID=3126503 RepID=UPI0030B159DF